LYCLKITNFCNKPVQATKETAGSDLRKNWCGYKNNWLAASYRPSQWLMALAEGSILQATEMIKISAFGSMTGSR